MSLSGMLGFCCLLIEILDFVGDEGYRLLATIRLKDSSSLSFLFKERISSLCF